MPVAMHDECFESSLMTHVLPVRCVASKMKWAVGSARSDTTAAAAARSKIWVNVIISNVVCIMRPDRSVSLDHE